jgi:hypothetical protein
MRLFLPVNTVIFTHPNTTPSGKTLLLNCSFTLSECGLTGIGFRQFDKFLLGYGKEWGGTRPKRSKLTAKGGAG